METDKHLLFTVVLSWQFLPPWPRMTGHEGPLGGRYPGMKLFQASCRRVGARAALCRGPAGMSHPPCCTMTCLVVHWAQSLPPPPPTSSLGTSLMPSCSWHPFPLGFSCCICFTPGELSHPHRTGRCETGHLPWGLSPLCHLFLSIQKGAQSSRLHSTYSTRQWEASLFQTMTISVSNSLKALHLTGQSWGLAGRMTERKPSPAHPTEQMTFESGDFFESSLPVIVEPI